MSSWASRRKTIYFWGVVLTLTAISFAIFWNFWYRAPSCSDGVRNGDEVGVDCGGSCSKICSLQAIPPVTRSDPRIFKVMDNVYSVAAFYENHNINYEAPKVPYTLRLLDEKNKVIFERKGTTAFPKNKSTVIFEGSILIPNSIPRRAEIELAEQINWVQNKEEAPEIEILSSPLIRQEDTPRIEASVKNGSLDDLRNIELIAVVFDSRDNAIAASRTFINRLNKGDTSQIFFTWPKPFNLGETSCEKPSDVVLALDRSGSMASLQKDPPEPLTSVKNAAQFFVSQLKPRDSIGLISFATEADSPLLNPLTKDFSVIVGALQSLEIKKDGTQYTNLADAIIKSLDALSANPESTTQKVIILLTDGRATRPLNPQGSKTEAEEIAYAEEVARKAAQLAKQQGVNLFTIGLGQDIGGEFLKQIASDPLNYFEAPSTTTLKDIYSKISSSICKERPARIEISYKILNFE